VHALLLAVALLPASVGAVTPPPVPAALADTRDPLTLPKPALARALTPLAPAGAQKPDPGRMRHALSSDGRHARVVVLLGAAELPPNGAETDTDLVMVRWLEHEFLARATPGGFKPTRGLSHFPIVAGEIDIAAIASLEGIPWVVSVAPDLQLVPARVEGGALVRAPRFRVETAIDGGGVGVAVVDTGVNASHPELAGRVVFSKDYTGSGSSDDFDGHGTGVAGIIAGTNGGMAPGATIWNARVLPGSSSTVLTGLNDLYANRNQLGGLDIVNLSLESDSVHSDSTCDGIDPAAAQLMNGFDAAGILIVAASGNQARRNGVSYPACLSKVIAVGAAYDADLGGPRTYTGAGCTDQTTAADTIPCYSNSGASLDLLAPSDCARAPGLGTSYIECFNGTSAAAPYAAGVAALLLSGRHDATPAELTDALKSTGRPITTGLGETRNRIDAIDAWSVLAGDTCVPEIEPIKCGTSTIGTIEPSECPNQFGSSHEFRTVQVAGGETIRVSCAPAGFTASVNLFRPDFTEAASSPSGGTLMHLAETSGEWWIEVARSAGPAAGDYTLSVSCGTPPTLPRQRPVRR
jgi:hypothetical protein